MSFPAEGIGGGGGFAKVVQAQLCGMTGTGDELSPESGRATLCSCKSRACAGDESSGVIVPPARCWDTEHLHPRGLAESPKAERCRERKTSPALNPGDEVGGTGHTG